MVCAISVLLVDDHALLRKSLHRMLDDDPELAVIGEAGNGEEAVELARELAPQVVVMDLAMPVMDGIQAARHILRLAPATAILMLSMSAEETCVRQSVRSGSPGVFGEERRRPRLGRRSQGRGDGQTSARSRIGEQRCSPNLSNAVMINSIG